MFTRTLTIIGSLLLGMWVSADVKVDESLLQALPQSCHLSGTYKQDKQIPDLSQTLYSEGNFVFSCERGLIWHTALPVVETIIYPQVNTPQIILPGSGPKALKGRVHRELGKILNNLIGADLQYLQKHFFITQMDQQIFLKPKNKRLGKFIQSITVSSHQDGTDITIQQAENEGSHIKIRDTQSRSDFDVNICAQHFVGPTLACTLLFQ